MKKLYPFFIGLLVSVFVVGCSFLKPNIMAFMVGLFFIVLIFAIIQIITAKKPLHAVLFFVLVIFQIVVICLVLLEMGKAF